MTRLTFRDRVRMFGFLHALLPGVFKRKRLPSAGPRVSTPLTNPGFATKQVKKTNPRGRRAWGIAVGGRFLPSNEYYLGDHGEIRKVEPVSIKNKKLRRRLRALARRAA